MPPASLAVSFRDATLADVCAVVDLVHSAYRGDSSRAGWTSEADLLDGARTDTAAVREVIGAARSVLLLAHPAAAAPGPPVACCHLADEGGGSGYFGMFAVQPGRQGAGIGSAMLAEAERRAASDWQCCALRMTVIRQRAELIAWYVRHGYAPTGATSPFPYGDERFGQPKRPDLEFVELAKAIA